MKQPIDFTGFPRGQSERLSAYARILEARAVPLGLISERDGSRILERHVLDSCRADGCIPATAQVVVDIGSGAGLPGVPVAILRPTLRVVLVESRQKRAAFLEFVVTELGLPNVNVLAVRAEDAFVTADVALARAVGDAATSWSLAHPLLTDDGCLVYFAGSSWAASDAARLERAGAVAEICDERRPVGGGPLVRIRWATHGPSTSLSTSQH